jgi:hypothetical protein
LCGTTAVAVVGIWISICAAGRRIIRIIRIGAWVIVVRSAPPGTITVSIPVSRPVGSPAKANTKSPSVPVARVAPIIAVPTIATAVIAAVVVSTPINRVASTTTKTASAVEPASATVATMLGESLRRCTHNCDRGDY